MEPRISLVTLGVGDLERAIRFYRDGLGWPTSGASGADVCFLRTSGAVLSLYPREELAKDAQVSADGSGFGGITLAHNVATREEVDEALAAAERAGATILKPAQMAEWGGYSGYFADPDGHPWEVAWNPWFPLGPDGAIQLPE
jgi:uncharacterized protein